METLARAANSGSVSTGYSIDNSVRFDNWYNYTGSQTGDDYMYRDVNDNAGFQSDISTQDSNNGQKWCLSFWTKRGTSWIGNPYDSGFDSHQSDATRNKQAIMGATNSARYSWIGFNSTGTTSSDDHQYDCFTISLKQGSTGLEYQTNAQYRDYSAWYHFFLKVDTTQATSTDRFQLWVNGVRVTSWQDYPTITQNAEQVQFWADGTRHYWARHHFSTGTMPYHGYIADCYFLHNDTEGNGNATAVDTGSYTATTFGEFNADGIWVPIEADVEYGNQAYHLDFQDASDLGKDVGGVGNHFDSFSMAAVNQCTDTPTNNFNTLIQVQNAQGGTMPIVFKGGLAVRGGGGSSQHVHASMGVSKGKWYWEYCQVDNADTALNHGAGWIGTHQDRVGYGSGWTALTTMSPGGNGNALGKGVNNWGASGTGNPGNNGHAPESGHDDDQYSGALAEGAVMGLAVDLDAGKMWWHIAGTWFSPTSGNVGNPATGANPSFTNIASVLAGDYLVSGDYHYTANSYISNHNYGNPPHTNFTSVGTYADGNGYGSFAYQPPSGFLAICSKNVGPSGLDSVINDPSKHYQTVLWTGTAAIQSITNDGNSDLQPDLLWFKKRSAVSDHRIIDSSRGVNKFIVPNSVVDSETYAGYTTSFNSDGFTIAVGDGSSNTSGEKYVGWQWKINGGTTSTDTNGDIDTVVQVNSTAKQSIVTYTAPNATARTIGHGLGVKPEFIIIKNLSRAIGENWHVFHHRAGVGGFKLDDTSVHNGDAVLGDTMPTSTVYKLGTDFRMNGDFDYVAYCFAGVNGYSRFGMYEGNMGTNHNVFKNGTFVYTGFKPAFVMIKSRDEAQDWLIFDNKRKRTTESGTYSADNGENSRWERLRPNSSAAQESGYPETGGAGNSWVVDDGFMDFLSNGFKLRIDTAVLGAQYQDDDELYCYAAFAERPFITSPGVPATAN